MPYGPGIFEVPCGVGIAARSNVTMEYDLYRFVLAQQPVYQQVLDELKSGRKRSHWMWFIFPQLAGLGRSDMARRYALSGPDEARAYLDHPLLGARLRDCSALVAAHPARAVDAIFAAPDGLKFHSCMTLFAQAAPQPSIFTQCLQKYFAGRPDSATLALLTNS